MTAEEIAAVRKDHKALLEGKLAAVPSFEPTFPTPSDQWRTMVWPASAEAMKNPDTGVPEQTLRNVGNASVTISSEGFVGISLIHPSHHPHLPVI
jgi:probable 2-oxoglutarate dehydrogenase E1 component DHKTD1